MGPPLVLTAPGPLCTNCGVRPAAPYFVAGLGHFKTCARCLRLGRARPSRHTKNRHRRCTTCRAPRARWTLPSGSYCTAECRRLARSRRLAQTRAQVLALLGGHCTCAGCTWHPGGCTVTEPSLLEVDHLDNDGHVVRKSRRDGTRSRSKGPCNHWSRYLREIRTTPTPRVQLLCANCHRAVTVARRQSVDLFSSGSHRPADAEAIGRPPATLAADNAPRLYTRRRLR